MSYMAHFAPEQPPKAAAGDSRPTGDSVLLKPPRILVTHYITDCNITTSVAVTSPDQFRHRNACAPRRLAVPCRLIFATFVAPVDLSSCSPPSPFDAHAGCFKRLRSRLSAPHFTDSHFHGPVPRLAHDTPDRLRPLLPRLFFGPSIPRQRQLLPRVPLRQNLCLARSRPALCGHAGLAANLHAASAGVLITAMWMAPVQAFMLSSQRPPLSHRPLFPVAADSASVQLHPNGTPFVARHISERLFS